MSRRSHFVKSPLYTIFLSMIKSFFFLAVIVCFLEACSNSSNTECGATEDCLILEEDKLSSEPDSISNGSDSINEFHEGMILVKGSEKVVIIGTNKKGARESETPELRTVLEYDYFMDSALVKCKDFKSIMAGTKLAQTLKCNDNEPITDITFFDAVLFANKRSSKEKLDSAYDYSKAVYDNEGHCTNLSSFLFRESRKGYRIPTEAEWIKAATSSYKFQFFSGKPMEWSNDFLGQLKDTTIVNFTGVKNANDLGERIVKRYNRSPDSTNVDLYSRGDVYTVTSASHADYIGFRLAIGAIPNAIWLDNKGYASSAPITILANSTDLWDVSKTTDMKMAFLNYQSGNLAYIDYAIGGNTITEINDTVHVFHPDISPDGKKVAFCTGIEGVSSLSNVYVRNLDSIGSNLVKLNVESAAIPRWKVLENGDTAITYVSNPGNNKDNATFKNYSTWQVIFANGKFGKPQKLFDGAYHGGISNGLAVSGARLLRARVHNKDTIWYNNEQACNVSLSKDNSKRTAFLDFGGKTGQTFVGKKYSTHQYILIADSTGNLTHYVQAPTGYTFDHSEWTVGNANDNIVATLANTDGAHKRITLIDLASNTSIDLVEGDELWHPCFWAKPQMKVSLSSSSNASEDTIHSSSSGFILDPDSAGLYYNASGIYPTADRWRYKMELLWGYKDSANIIALGSSRTENGIKPLAFTSPAFAVNFGSSGNSIQGSYLFLEKYLFHHIQNLKVIIFELDIDRWSCCNNSLLNNPYKHYSGYVYDENHNFWKDYYPPNLYNLTYDSPGTPSIAAKYRKNRGQDPISGSSWNYPEVSNDSTWLSSNKSLFYKKIDMLKEIIQISKEKNIFVIGVIFPQNPQYKETGAFGRYGLLRSEAPSLIEEIQAINKIYPNFILFDENKMGDHDYPNELAQGTDHLNANGAEKITHRLDSLIQTLDIDWN